MYPIIFDMCMEVIFKHEGGYQCDKDDLGNWTGPNCTGVLKGTKYGIAARYFPNEDIKNLTKERAKQIYFEKYWMPMKLTGIVNAIHILEIFDMGINAGRGNAIRIAQRIVNTVPDGAMGNITRNAINECDNFLIKYKDARREYYKLRTILRPKNKKFLDGWLKRVNTTKFIS